MDGTSRCCIYWEIVNLQEKKANPDGEYQDPIKNLKETMCLFQFAYVFPWFSRVFLSNPLAAGLSDGMSPRATNLEMEEDFKTEMCLIGMDEWDEPGLHHAAATVQLDENHRSGFPKQGMNNLNKLIKRSTTLIEFWSLIHQHGVSYSGFDIMGPSFMANWCKLKSEKTISSPIFGWSGLQAIIPDLPQLMLI